MLMQKEIFMNQSQALSLMLRCQEEGLISVFGDGMRHGTR